MRIRNFLLACLLCLTCTSEAAADEDPNMLFNQALELAQNGKTEQAVSLWLKVLHKVDDRFRPSVHRTLGLGFGKLGQFPEAAYHLRSYLDTRLEAQSKKTRQKLVEIEEKLAATHFQMTIACDPADAVIHLNEDGTGTGYSCPLKWWFPKGRHAVRVARVGYRPSVTHVSVQEGQESRLHAVALGSLQPDSDEQREQKMDLLRQLEKAATAGQISVINTMAAEHGSLLKELPCAYGWKPALRGLTVSTCNTEVVTALVEAGAQRCPTSGELDQATELGCPQLVEYMLPLLSDTEVATALQVFSTTPRYNPTVAEAKNMLTAAEMGLARLRKVCANDAIESKPCSVVKEVDEELSSFYGAIVTRVTDETLMEILALRPKLTRRYHCTMVTKLIGALQPDRCSETVRKLALFYLNDGPPCDHRENLRRTVRSRCTQGVAMLLKTALAEDVAAATAEYNSANGWVPTGVWTDHTERTKEALALGKRLQEANAGSCKKLGPQSAACGAARYVEEQMEVIRAGQKAITQPAAILKELCALQHDLDGQTTRLQKLKRVEELSGVRKDAERFSLAEAIIGYETSLEKLSRRYLDTSRKKYSPKLCK